MAALIYAVASGFVIACGSLVEKLGLTTVQPYAALFIRAGAVAIFLAASALPFRGYADFAGFTARSVLLIAAGGVLAGLVAHFLYWQSLKATSPDYALPIMLGASQAAVVLLSVGVLRTKISVGQVLGVAMVVLGIALIQTLKPR